MFIAKKDDAIIMAKETREELEESLKFMLFDTIEETNILYKLVGGTYLSEEKAEIKENEIASLHFLTAADVERAIYKTKGLDFDDILEFVKDNQSIDSKALKIELKANNFYRGNPYVSAIGNLLGFTEEQLDKFFETGNYEELM